MSAGNNGRRDDEKKEDDVNADAQTAATATNEEMEVSYSATARYTQQPSPSSIVFICARTVCLYLPYMVSSATML